MARCSRCKTKQVVDKKGQKKPVLHKSKGMILCDKCLDAKIATAQDVSVTYREWVKGLFGKPKRKKK